MKRDGKKEYKMYEAIVRGVAYRYFGGYRTKATAQETVKRLKQKGHKAVVRRTTIGHFPWAVYWYDVRPKRQPGLRR